MSEDVREPEEARRIISETGVSVGTQQSQAGFLKNNLREYGLLISLLVIMLFFEIVTEGTLLRPLSLTNLVLQNSYIVVMALGMLLVIVSGHIDLSVGSVTGFVSALAAVMIVTLHMPFLLAILLCLIVGGLIGALQGYWVAYFKIPSFIVTLAGMLVFKGAMLNLLGGLSIGPFPQDFQLLSTGFIPELLSGNSGMHVTSVLIGILVALVLAYMSYRNRARQISHGIETEPSNFFLVKNALQGVIIVAFTTVIAFHRGLPNVLVIMLILIALYAFVTTRTTIGRQVYAVGGNEKAAKLSGIKTERLVLFTFVSMGMLSALAGLIVAARFNGATPQIGTGFELDVIAACFIGGASAYGGVGKVVGAVIGAFIMGVMNMGMSTLGLGIDYQFMIKGVVLLGAVMVDVYNQRR